MPRNCARFCLLAALSASLLIAGCGSQQAKTTPSPDPSKIGVIAMDKAIKAHPKYVEVQRLQKDYAVLAARADAQRAQNSSDAGLSTTAGAEQAAAKEFDARMGAKQAEVNTRLQAAANQASREMAAELDAYARELDQEYQPKLFSIQLKLKTVQLSKEEAAPLQAEMDKLQQERADKIAVRQRELLAKTDEVMKGKQRDAENELASYAQALNSELAGKLAGQRDAAVNRPPTAGMSGDGAEVEKMAALQRDIASLQDFVLSDIRDKAAKVAVQSGLDAVLAEVKVNVSATDITDAVIAEFKK